MEKLTNKEAIERLKCMRLFMQINDKSSERKFLEEDYVANNMAVAALEELENAKETIRKLLCSEYGSSCQFCVQDDNENAMCRKVGGSGGWCCENAAWNGKSD